MQIDQPFLTTDELLNELQQRKGLVPVSIEAEKKALTWTDIGMYHFYEGFFRTSMGVYKALKKDPVSFTTRLDLLEDDRILNDFIYPTGFIFHAGHCRSTALAKSLARSRKNLVLSEAAPLSQILAACNKAEMVTEKNKHMYRNLVLAMCRRRLPTHERAFIKFTSYNIHFFELIHSAFPDVPSIFLTRDEAGIITSFQKQPPGWLKEENNLEEKVKGFLIKAGSIPSEQLLLMDHLTVTPENLFFILHYFKVCPDQTELNLMQSQFNYDSKVEFNRKFFKN